MKFKECVGCPLSLACAAGAADNDFVECRKWDRRVFVFGEAIYLIPATCPMQQWVAEKICHTDHKDVVVYGGPKCSTCQVTACVWAEQRRIWSSKSALTVLLA